MEILKYFNRDMSRQKSDQNTRQIYASIREDIYLAAKARATELRMPLREFIEYALELALSGQTATPQSTHTIWNDEYLRMQMSQPLGSPVELTDDEAQEVIRATFGTSRDSTPDGVDFDG